MHDPCHCAMLMGTVHFSALIIVLMNLIIDISYGFLDPRVRYKK
jgi:peptide/nickel transport system permease protein